MKKIICVGIALWVICIQNLFSQELHDYGFVKDISIAVMRGDSNSSPYLYPLTGGMNNVQFGWLDCDGDGTKDLIAFDVHGSRILPFLKTAHGYEYAPHYAHYFPQMTGFMQLIDFDKDGKEDIFTYHEAGIKVYRNISTTSLQFELFTEQILSIYNPGRNPINLFCTEGDYVVIRDIDGDGDVDILAFWSLGKYIDYHKNKSIEQHGTPAYLTFELENRCWGLFSESNEYNAIILDDDCKGNSLKSHRHTGSTMLSFDENGNGLPDLLLGDMDYPNLFLLTNGGTANVARMVSKDSLFPSYDTPIQLYSMPCPLLVDVDGDGLEDLLVSPFDLTLTKSENKESVWYYKNTGTSQHPRFTLQTKSFLQEEMLDFGSGAYPVLYDMDGDGLLDLLVGNYGYYDSTTSNGYSITCYYSAAVAYFRNTGSKSKPVFSLVTEDLADLRKLGYTSLIPSVGDLNGDGKPDILLGTATHNLIYLENNSASSETLTFSSPVFNYKSLSVSNYAAVQLFDLDKDGLTDLITGNQNGKISCYRNTGTGSEPTFTPWNDSLGKINVRDFDYSYFGYATPCFFRTD
ncbi:MAG: VCBS repeat-containing protein, partial [Bacteroidales bacterium]|nr:VCBS repeat-containing protein [Bacteroidales bacterium]